MAREGSFSDEQVFHDVISGLLFNFGPDSLDIEIVYRNDDREARTLETGTVLEWRLRDFPKFRNRPKRIRVTPPTGTFYYFSGSSLEGGIPPSRPVTSVADPVFQTVRGTEKDITGSASGIAEGAEASPVSFTVSAGKTFYLFDAGGGIRDAAADKEGIVSGEIFVSPTFRLGHFGGASMGAVTFTKPKKILAGQTVELDIFWYNAYGAAVSNRTIVGHVSGVEI